MANTTPHVFRRHLTYQERSQEYELFLDSPEWWEWLDREGTRIFRFTGLQGHFTARRENKHGRWYWYAYQKDRGTLLKAYLGKAEDLTEQHLERVAHVLTQRGHAFGDLFLKEALSLNPMPQRSGVSRQENDQERLPLQSTPRSDGKAPEEFPLSLNEEGSDEQVAAWHLKAAHWYEQNGFLDEGLHHLLAAHHFPDAAQVLERSCERLMKSGKIATLLRWLQALPDEYIQSRPYLSLYYAGALLSTEQFDEAERHLRDAEQAIGAVSQQEIDVAVTQRFQHSQVPRLLDALAVTRASLAGFRGDIAQAMELSRQARAQFTKADAYLESVLLVSLGMAYLRDGNLAKASEIFRAAEAIGESAHHFHLSLASASAQAYLLMEQGHLQQAADHYQQLLRLATEEGQQPAALGSAYLGLGELHYDWNELDLAEHSLRRGLQGEQHWEPMTALVRGSLFLAKIHHVRGEKAKAFEHIQLLEEQVLQLHLQHFLPPLGAIRASLWLAEDEVEKASRWAQGSGLRVDDELNYLDEMPYLILAQVLARSGRLDDATRLLSRLLICAEGETRMRSVVDILVCQACLFQQQGNDDQAEMSLLRALSLAVPESWLRVFIDQGRQIQTLLSTVVAGHVKKPSAFSPFLSSVQAILVAIEKEHPGTLLSSAPSVYLKSEAVEVSLTTREREVLHFVALGLSNSHIARELVVAVSTVKWHLKQISMKLAVHNRTHMVTRARELHLL